VAGVSETWSWDLSFLAMCNVQQSRKCFFKLTFYLICSE
jgi:hypothetical protein